MHEQDSSETKPIEETGIKKADVIDALRKAKKAGIPNPDSTTEESAREIQQVVGDYRDMLTNKARRIGSDKVRLLADYLSTVILVDGGYDDDPEYVDAVIYWLYQNLDEAESFGEHRVAELIQAKIDELEEILKRLVPDQSQ